MGRLSAQNGGRDTLDYVKTYRNYDFHTKYGFWHDDRNDMFISADEFNPDWGDYYRDPWLKPMIMYLQKHSNPYYGGKDRWDERYNNKTGYAWPVGGGMNIFVRDSTSNNDTEPWMHV